MLYNKCGILIIRYRAEFLELIFSIVPLAKILKNISVLLVINHLLVRICIVSILLQPSANKLKNEKWLY